VNWWGRGGRREDDIAPSSHLFRIRWSTRDRIESEVLHALTSWESVEDLALKREEVLVNKMIEVLFEGPEFRSQVD
jgi:hypothetical protein